MSEKRLLDDLRTLLFEGQVETQEEIRQALVKRGHSVTQSKISRLLRKIGAVKSKNEDGQVVYRLPKEPAPPTLHSHIAGLVLDVVNNETLVLVHVSPGAAQLIARVLDYHRDSLNILGTIAGDDTIWVMPKSIYKMDETVQAIKESLL